METVEVEGRQWRRDRGGIGAEAAHRVLETLRAARAEQQSLTIEDEGLRGNLPGRRDHLRQAIGDVPQIPGEHPHPVTGAVHLDSCPVQLPLDHCRAQCGNGLPGRCGGLGQHRLHRREDRDPGPVQCLGSPGQGPGCDPDQVSLQHGGPSHPVRLHSQGERHGVGHDPLQRPLTQVAQDQAAQEALLRAGGPGQQVREGGVASLLGARAGRRRQILENGVHLQHLDGGCWSRLGLDSVDRRPAHPEAVLTRAAGQKGDGHRRLRWRDLAQHPGEDLDLFQPGASGGNGFGDCDDVGEEHRSRLPVSRRKHGWPPQDRNRSNGSSSIPASSSDDSTCFSTGTRSIGFARAHGSLRSRSPTSGSRT